jgi:hypothetical protein
MSISGPPIVLLEEAEMANGFNGVSQARALFVVMSNGYHPMGPLFQVPADHSWTCVAVNMEDKQMYNAKVSQKGDFSSTQL